MDFAESMSMHDLFNFLNHLLYFFFFFMERLAQKWSCSPAGLREDPHFAAECWEFTSPDNSTDEQRAKVGQVNSPCDFPIT